MASEVVSDVWRIEREKLEVSDAAGQHPGSGDTPGLLMIRVRQTPGGVMQHRVSILERRQHRAHRSTRFGKRVEPAVVGMLPRVELSEPVGVKKVIANQPPNLVVVIHRRERLVDVRNCFVEIRTHLRQLEAAFGGFEFEFGRTLRAIARDRRFQCESHHCHQYCEQRKHDHKKKEFHD